MQTKFNVGDEVFVVRCEGRILYDGNIEIEPHIINEKIKNIGIGNFIEYYFDNLRSGITENRVFKTKEEAKEFIRKNVLKSLSELIQHL